MWRSGNWGPALGAVLTLCFALAPGPTNAGELKGGTLGTVQSWTALPVAELAEQRAGDAYAGNNATQDATNTLTATTVTGGDIIAGDGAFSQNSLSVSIFNTGNNAVLQATAAIVVNITP